MEQGGADGQGEPKGRPPLSLCCHRTHPVSFLQASQVVLAPTIPIVGKPFESTPVEEDVDFDPVRHVLCSQ